MSDQLTIGREDSDAIFAALRAIGRTLETRNGQGARRRGRSLRHLEQHRLDSFAPEQIRPGRISNTQLAHYRTSRRGERRTCGLRVRDVKRHSLESPQCSPQLRRNRKALLPAVIKHDLHRLGVSDELAV